MRIKELSTDIQALSHELHSSKLEYLGIVGGMKSWCREFGERQGMQIEFKHSGSLSSVPSQTSVCLFRVLQEALHNSAKHSGVKNVDVQLRTEPGEVQLIVHDLGKGFDVAVATQGRGLGVTSMLERFGCLAEPSRSIQSHTAELLFTLAFPSKLTKHNRPVYEWLARTKLCVLRSVEILKW